MRRTAGARGEPQRQGRSVKQSGAAHISDVWRRASKAPCKLQDSGIPHHIGATRLTAVSVVQRQKNTCWSCALLIADSDYQPRPPYLNTSSIRTGGRREWYPHSVKYNRRETTKHPGKRSTAVVRRWTNSTTRCWIETMYGQQLTEEIESQCQES